jgi:hypothetical protein
MIEDTVVKCKILMTVQFRRRHGVGYKFVEKKKIEK